MSRKSHDAPIKLIQLVPSNGEEEIHSVSSSDVYDQRLRLQIGIEGEPSWGTRIWDVLSRAFHRNSNRFSSNHQTNKEQSPASQRTPQFMRGLNKIHGALRPFFFKTVKVLVGCKHALVSVCTRFHRTDDDLDDLVQVRLNRRDPQRSYDSIPSQEMTTGVDQKDDALAREIHALREEFNAQQYELSRVNNFVMDLKSRVVAQQKMILSLAEELDAVALETSSSGKGVSKESGVVQRH